MPVDPIGISLNDNSSLLTDPPSILLYGPPGAGKTTAGAIAFPNMLWLVSSPTNLRSVAAWIRDNPKEAAEKNVKVPAFKYIARYGGASGTEKMKVRDVLTQVLVRCIQSANEGKFPYDGVAIDEYSDLLNAVYEDIKADSSYGKNAFAKIDALKEFNAWVCSVPRQMKKAQLLITHDAPPKYDEDENSPTFRQMLAKGGPTMPIATERTKMAAAADICLRIQLTQVGMDTKRTFMTQANALWETKFRDTSIKSTEDKIDLRELLIRAGYTL